MSFIVSALPLAPFQPLFSLSDAELAELGVERRTVSEPGAPCRVTTADAVGWSSDAMEAQAFGYLAARTLQGLPLTFPTTTGVRAAMSGGRIARPA